MRAIEWLLCTIVVAVVGCILFWAYAEQKVLENKEAVESECYSVCSENGDLGHVIDGRCWCQINGDTIKRRQ